MNVIRADVVGSLLRPPSLVDARARHRAGELSSDAFKQIEDRAVDQVIAMQEGAGLDIVTDGEMRRFLFMDPVLDDVEGIEPVTGNAMPWRTDKGTIEIPLPFGITGKLRKRRSSVAEEYAYARARARLPLKVTVPSPLLLTGVWTREHSAGVYPDPWAMAADAAEIVRSEVQELVRLGCTCIQLDAPELGHLVDPETRAWYQARGVAPDRMLTEGIDLINAVVADVRDARLCLHLCRGNWNGAWMSEGGYDAIASALFVRATAFDAFLLEYDDPRSGSFDPLIDAPDDRQIVLGLVSTKQPELETPTELRKRIDEAARFCSLEQLAISTQCGSASDVSGNPITADIEERKLRLVAETAREVWG